MRYFATRKADNGTNTLFPTLNQQLPQPEPTPKNEDGIRRIRGLQYVADYITELQHDWLLNAIDKLDILCYTIAIDRLEENES